MALYYSHFDSIPMYKNELNNYELRYKPATEVIGGACILVNKKYADQIDVTKETFVSYILDVESRYREVADVADVFYCMEKQYTCWMPEVETLEQLVDIMCSKYRFEFITPEGYMLIWCNMNGEPKIDLTAPKGWEVRIYDIA